MPNFNKYGSIDDVILQDGDRAFLRMNTRLRPNQLKPGEVALSENGRMETDGTWQPREGYDNLTGALSQDGVALYALDAGETGIIPLFDTVDIASSSADGAGTISITTSTDHGRSVGETVRIEGITGGTGDPNGNRVITAVGSSTTFDFVDTAITYSGSYDALTGDVVIVKLDESTLVEVLGSCTFSDPSDDAKEWVVIATTNKAIAYDLSAADVEASATDITYPGAATLSTDVDMRQAFDKVFLFRSGATAWSWDGDLGGGLAFAAVSSGTYTQPDELTGVATITTDGKVSMAVTSHGLSTGDKLLVIDANGTELTEGDQYVVTKVNDNTFTFYADVDDTATGATIVLRKRVSVAGGYIHMPGAAWGVYAQRRFWMPYTHTAASSPAARNKLDEVIASDILDPDTFDPVGSQFVVTAGIADYVVGMYPFNDDNLLVFNRNSIHLLKGVSGSLADVQTVEVTREIGMVARKSAVSYGNQILFLSDAGVYALSFQDEYNLRGTELPLSEAVQSLIDRINDSAASKAVATYHDNRYFLAVPLDDSTENTHVLVYSFLNGGWESLDFTGASNFNILQFHVARAESYNELYAVTSTGGLYQLTRTDRDTDELINNAVSNTVTEIPIPSMVKTRQYTMDSLDRKKWNRAEYQVKSNSTSASNGSISITIEDPDATVTLPNLSSSLGGELVRDETASIISRIGNNRGFGAQLTFTPFLGRPSLRSVRLQGMATFKSGTSVQ